MEGYLKGIFDSKKYVIVNFAGDSAVDKGGPLREYFHLLIKHVAQMNIFCGPWLVGPLPIVWMSWTRRRISMLG